MKLTTKDVAKINEIPSLVELCKLVTKIQERGVNPEYPLSIIESLIPLLKKECSILKIVNVN